jgi:phosphatidate phosphatase APP1
MKAKELLRAAIHRIEGLFDRLDVRTGASTRGDRVVITPYVGYGHGRWVRVLGRVLEDEEIRVAEPGDSFVRNLVRSIKRFATDEVPHARLRLRCGDDEVEASADDEGYFDVCLRLSGREVRAPSESVTVELLGGDAPAPRATARARALVAGEAARFGVISDIDDTVIRSGATKTLTLYKKVLLGNARTRMPFAGVARLYEALRRGGNPVFYVSSSPWNLYGVLRDTLDVNGIPEGPLMLRDLGVDEDKLIKSSHEDHKKAIIERILADFPELPFVLIGDSGQRDPWVYRDVAMADPGRIAVIYIRDVTRSSARARSIETIRRALARVGVPLVLTADSEAAARHAARHGLIDPGDVERVAHARAADEQQPRS